MLFKKLPLEGAFEIKQEKKRTKEDSFLDIGALMSLKKMV